tara:strand:+ start:24 stop:443 length:420 start_codon:yes stop_codon:yes gene_type:complete
MEYLQKSVGVVKKMYKEYEKKQPDSLNRFKEKYPFERRKLESEKIIAQYPTRVPIIVERYNKGIQQIDRKKYLAPEDLSMANFLYVIRKRLQLRPEKGLYLFINDKLIPMSNLLGHVYDLNKDEDGFLYIKYCEESTFG